MNNEKAQKLVIVTLIASALFLAFWKSIDAIAAPPSSTGVGISPQYIPLEVNVSPSSSSITAPNYDKTRNVYLTNGVGSYCTNVTYGDGCSSNLCGYTNGNNYHRHVFNCTLRKHQYTQSWAVSGTYGSAYDTSTVTDPRY